MPLLRSYFGQYRHHLPRILRVFCVGGVGFVIAMLVFEALGIRTHFIAAITATIIAGELAILSNFFLNERFSFRDTIATATSRSRRILRFHLVSSVSLSIQWLLVFLVERMTDTPMLLRGAYLAGIGIGFLSNYLGYVYYVWRKEHPSGFL